MLWELIAVGGFLFWGVIALAFAAIIAALEYENGKAATVVAVIFALAMTLFSDFKPIEWLTLNWKSLIWYAAAYVGIGILWGVIKWRFYVMNRVDRYDDLKAKFLDDNNIKEKNIPDEYKKQWAAHCRNEFGYGFRIPMQVSHYKSTIIMWMSYWPFSGFWTLLNDPVKRIFRFCYRHMAGGLQKISDHAFADAKADF
jgi:hypothetical protein